MTVRKEGHMDRKEKILADLMAQKCENRNEEMSKRVLTKLIESDFGIDLAGTETDETGSLFGYVIHKPTMLEKFSGGLFVGILVFPLQVSDSITLAYIGEQLERIEVFGDDEKELCLNNIEQTLIAG